MTTVSKSGAVLSEPKSNELLLSNMLDDGFVRLVGHELRSPMTTILGYARLIKSRPNLDSEMMQEAVIDIDREGVRLQRMIENFLLLARPELPIKPSEPLLLSRQVQIIVKEFRQHSSREVEIDDTGMEDSIALADAASLTHVLENLLNNAAAYAPSEDALVVKISSDDSEAYISVLDRGPGVSGEDRQSIFESFSTLEGSQGKAHGMGLGLVLCNRLVGAQGGRIWVADRDGGGAEFTFTLPLAD